MSLNTIPTHENADSYVTIAEANSYLANRQDVAEWTALTDDQKEAVLKLATKQIDSFRFFHEPIIECPNYYRLEQALKFPRTNAKQYSGVVTSATANTLVCSGLIDQINIPNDLFNAGALLIKSGTGKGQTVKITDFNSTTGTFTIDGTFTTTPDTTSQFLAIEQVPLKVKYATIEQALYLAQGGGERAKLQSEGVQSYSIGDLSETFVDGSTNKDKIALSNDAKGFLAGYVSKIGVLI